MKLFWVCDARTAFPLGSIPYLGKEGNARAAVGIGERIVVKLCKPYFGTNRLVTFDNFFGSYNLAKKLLKNKLMSIATIKKNKRFVPQSFLPNKIHSIYSSMFGFRKKCTLVSYVPKKSKAVLLLSTLHNSEETAETETQKPKIILDYNNTKGGVDTFDQMVHEYSSKRKTNRWPFAYFTNLLDASALAAYIVWISIHETWNVRAADRRCCFLKQLCENLVKPLIARRKENFVGICTETQSAMELFLPTINDERNSVNPIAPSSAALPGQRRRCRLCPYSLGRKQKQTCDRCKSNICNAHCSKKVLCDTCDNKLKMPK